MSEQYYGNTQVEMESIDTWNNRQGNNVERIFHGEYNTLSKIGDNLIKDPNEKANGLVNVTVSKPDPTGHAILTATYQQDQTYQWTFQSNQIENDIYLHPKYYAFMRTLGTTESSQSAYYNSLINGIALGVTKGMMLEELISYVPVPVTILSQTESSSLSRFQALYPGLSAAQQASASNLYVIKSRQLGSYNFNQVVLRKQLLVSNWDKYTAALHMELVNNVMTKEYINANFTTNTPIPSLMYTGMDSNYWLYQGPIVEEQNTGKLLVSQEWYFIQEYEHKIYGEPLTV